MRDHARIKRIAQLLIKAWHHHPDLRLYQMIELAKARALEPRPAWDLDSFYVEDDLWEAGLRSLTIKP